MNSPLGGSLAGFITILHGGGGQANLLQYYMGAGGSAETPKLYYVIYEQPLMMTENELFYADVLPPKGDKQVVRLLP